MVKTKSIFRLFAVLMSVSMIIMMLSVIPIKTVTVSAICCCKDGFDKSRYTLTGNMAEDVATIAKSQKGRTEAEFGYSGVDAGAWCDEFVADCLENAGADSSIVAHGGTVADFESKMRARNAVEVSSPRTGDLIFFTKSHVEIVTRVENGVVYCAGGNNSGRMCKGERSASSVGTTRLYLRPNYSVPAPNTPTYSNLTENKTMIAVGEEITFNASSDYATGFTIGIYEGTDQHLVQAMPNGKLTLTFDKTGEYGAFVSAYNSMGYVDSNWVGFTVYDSAPTYSSLTADKTTIAIGEEITFTASSDYATGYTIGIDNEVERYLTQGIENGKLTLAFDKAGEYGAFVSAYNSMGYVDSNWVGFTVYDSAPTYSSLTADKTTIAIGEEITFTASSDYATGYTIGIDNEVERYLTQGMENGKLTLAFDKAGEYRAYITSYNSIGYADSEWISFTVYNSSPTYSKLVSDKTMISVGEEITFTASSDLGNVYWIGIDNESERYITKEMINKQLTLTFDKAGSYSAYVTSSNSLGGKDSACIYFTVYDSNQLQGDINADGKFDTDDIEILQKWLLAAPDTELDNWKAADLCEDGIIDTYDLILLRKLISDSK